MKPTVSLRRILRPSPRSQARASVAHDQRHVRRSVPERALGHALLFAEMVSIIRPEYDDRAIGKNRELCRVLILAMLNEAKA